MIEAMLRKRLIVIWMLAAAATLSGCMDDPSSVGAGLIPASDLLQIDTVVVASTSSHSEKAAPLSFMNLPTTFAVGKSENFEAWSLIQFTGFSDTLNRIAIQGADLHLRAVYHLGDSLGQFSLAMHTMLTDWNRISFVYDSLLAPGTFDASSTPFNLGSIGDTDEVVLPLDTALVMTWFRAAADTTYRNFGIVLEPTNSTVIKGFASYGADYSPYLEVRYADATSGLTDTLHLGTSIFKTAAGMADTSAFTDSTLLFARGSAAYRGVVNFNASVIPSHALIHRAYLEVHTDPAASRFGSNHHDSLYALFANTLNPVQISESVADSGQNYFRFNVTEFVSAIVRGADPQISLGVYEEENTVELFRIFGSAATNPDKRPRLTVLYSRTR